ncbi:NADH dehydrogenase [ubiquinone] 1 subunit C1, mitochondrial [Ornithorhynchus anatinus]|uniref:NADH dehydrogenase [ubiquinone] 1 subunit C1, mitochondrial n=1 Tax=Ornithorhynchus anatinus TaxID=9258 RepID=A0A6I8NGI0_ORNAN|nr:NADH dehydrogenase [ubiquinone] 1 subunit C1, mitochondrial [Ornithorhynchus anatinus]XP_028932893.1 NADH dehydrogenase [ubiquinone] 1 subunit C1, mitochondrial [Ornithorhynchus anatinus]
MAAAILARLPGRLRPVLGAGLPGRVSTRSTFNLRDENAKPNWLKVGLTLGTSVFLWAFLIHQHNEDVLEYKRRNGLE